MLSRISFISNSVDICILLVYFKPKKAKINIIIRMISLYGV